MINHLRLKLNNTWVAAASIIGVGLLPCPDCGIPLATHVWPIAALVWVYRRLRRRSLNNLDLLLTSDLTNRIDPHTDDAETGSNKSASGIS